MQEIIIQYTYCSFISTTLIFEICNVIAAKIDSQLCSIPREMDQCVTANLVNGQYLCLLTVIDVYLLSLSLGN